MAAVTRRAAAALSLGAASLALAACGVPTDRRPVDLARADVPYGLIEPATTSTTALGPKAPVALIQVFLVSGNRLVPVGRTIPSPATLQGAIGSLLAGPTAKDAGAGLRSAINEQTALLGARLDKGRAVIDLSQEFANVGGPSQILAVAQLVFTATGLPDVGSVSFELDDHPVAVPAADGTLEQAPVTRADFAPLLVPGV